MKEITTVEYGQKQLEKHLESMLEEIESAPQNHVTIDEFRRFSPLFNNEKAESLTDEEIMSLSEEFNYKFNIYSTIFVYDSSKEEVLHEIQPAFKRLNSLNVLPTDSEEFSADQIFTNLAGHEMPNYSRRGVDVMKRAIRKAQVVGTELTPTVVSESSSTEVTDEGSTDLVEESGGFD